MAETTCRACGARVIWARTRAGKAMPLDAEPVDGVVGGTCVIRKGVALFGAVDGPPGEPRYVSHFATCEFAASFRRPR